MGSSKVQKKTHVKKKVQDKGKKPSAPSTTAKAPKSAEKPEFIPLGFKYQPRSSQLKALPNDLASLLQKAQHTSVVSEEEDLTTTPILEVLSQKQLSNTSIPFVTFARTIEPWCRSVPLVLHHRKEICLEISKSLDGPGRYLCTETILELIPPLIETLPSLPVLAEIFPPVIQSLIHLIASNLPPKIIEQCVNTLTIIYSECGKQLVENPQQMWYQIRIYLGANNDDTKNDTDDIDPDHVEQQQNVSQEDKELNEDLADIDFGEEDEEDQDSSKKKKVSRIKINPKQRKLLASAYALLLRKAAFLDKTVLDSFYNTILDDLCTNPKNSTLSESLAIMLCESCKGIDTRLHSLASSIISTYLQNPKCHMSTLTHALVPLLHYSRAEHLIPLVKVILQNGNYQLLNVLAAVRRGERVDPSQRVLIYEQASKLGQGCGVLAFNLLAFAKFEEIVNPKAAAPMVTNIASQGGDEFYILARSLSNRKFAWFKDLMLDHVLQVTERDQHNEAISLLSTLVQNDQLPKLPNKLGWLQNKIQSFLSNWKPSLETQDTLQAINLTKLIPFTDISDTKIEKQLIKTILEIPVEEHVKLYKQSPVHLALVLYELLLSAKHMDSFEISDFNKVSQMFYWHPLIMKRLTQIDLPQESIDATFVDNILSQDSTLRQSALQLHAKGVLKISYSTVAKQANDADLIPLTFQNEREKRAAIRKIAISSKSFQNGSSELDFVLRYLLSMLKLNYKPVWSETIEAIANLGQNIYPDLWNIMSSQLDQCVSGDENLDAMVVPQWDDTSLNPDNKDQPVIGQPFSASEWNCYNFRNLKRELQASLDWNSQQKCQLAVAMNPPRTLDVNNYQIQLLSLISKLPLLVDRKNAEIITAFFNDFGSNVDAVDWTAGGKQDRPRLEAWLKAFTTGTNPKSYYKTDTLHELYLRLLAVANSSVQRLAIECILTYKSPVLKSNQDLLFELVDSKSFRDALLQTLPIMMGENSTKATQDQLLPVVIRIFYGIITTRGDLQKSRRSAILSTLRSCPEEFLNAFVNLMVSPFDVNKDDNSDLDDIQQRTLSRRQLGFLMLFGDVLKHLGSLIMPRIADLLQVTVHIISSSASSSAESNRKIRSLAFKRLADASTFLPYDELKPFIAKVVSVLISPRIDNFTNEISQSNSALLELISVWSSQEHTIPALVDFEPRLLDCIFKCLSVPKAHSTVISKVIGIILNILNFANSEKQEKQDDNVTLVNYVNDQVLKPKFSVLMESLGDYLEKIHSTFNARKDVGTRSLVTALTMVADRVTTPSDARRFVKLLRPLLERSSSTVPEEIKASFLSVVYNLNGIALEDQPMDHDGGQENLVQTIYNTLCQLFNQLNYAKSRTTLTNALGTLVPSSPLYKNVHDLLTRLNAYTARRHEEPDFDIRLAAYAQINDHDYQNLQAYEWKALVYNMLYFIRDTEEMSLRNNANFALKRFVQIASSEQVDNKEFSQILTDIMLPCLRTYLRSKSDIVRGEALSLISEITSKCTTCEEVIPLRPLLVGGDAEANFFNNIQHLQVHRRARALRKLADETKRGVLTEHVIKGYLLPMVSHFIIDQNVTDNTLVNDAQNCMGSLCSCLSWGTYYRTLTRFFASGEKPGPRQKVFLRTAVQILRAFHFELAEADDSIDEDMDDDDGEDSEEQDDDSENEGEDEDEDEDEDDEEEHQQAQQAVYIFNTIKQRLLPRLMKFLEVRVENESSVRIPLAEGVAAMLRYFPDDQKQYGRSLIIILAQMLRIKIADVRDQTRSTLCNIYNILGDDYFPIILKELSSALYRGPHLHVLGFTMHTMLLKAHEASEEAGKPLNFDSSLSVIVPVITKDLFGQPAKERDNTEFKSKTPFKEVKQSKSSESFRLLVQHISPQQLGRVLTPLREVLRVNDHLRTLKDVEDLFTKIAQGIQSNKNFTPQSLLELCQSLISLDAEFLRPAKLQKNPKIFDPTDHIVRKSEHEDPDQYQVDHYPKNKTKFEGLGLDLLIASFSRNRFDLEDENIVARLDPLVALVGNTLYSKDTSVVCRGLRAIGTLVRLPLHSVNQASPLLLKQCLKIIQNTGTLDSELGQADLKTLAIIIRTCKSVEVTDKELVKLLRRISGDFETPEVQHSVFGVVRAIISRNFVIPEIYDLMERTAELLVKNPSSNIREICRSIFLQFLLDYPQGRGRLKTSLEFLSKNLSYVHESGRTSVMELLHAVFTKFSPDVLSQYFDTFFFSLVMVLTNDESAKCREMASYLIRLLLEKSSKEKRQQGFTLLFSWAKHQDSRLKRVSFLILGNNIDQSTDQVENTIQKIIEALVPCISECAQGLLEAELEDDNDNDDNEDEGKDKNDVDVDWELAYQALQCLFKCLDQVQDPKDFVPDSCWNGVRVLMLAPHHWIRRVAARLCNSVLQNAPESVIDNEEAVDDQSPYSEKSLRETMTKSLLQLRSKQLDEELAGLATKNLLAVGKIFVKREPEPVAVADENSDKNCLTWYFDKICSQARKAIITKPSVYAKEKYLWTLNPAGLLHCVSEMTGEMNTKQIETLLTTIMEPIYRIIELPDVNDEPTKELQNVAQSAHSRIQSQVGTSVSSAAYNEVRKMAVKRKNERKTAEALKAVEDPSGHAERKAKRTEATARRHKRKQQSFADRRLYGDDIKTKRKKT